MTAGAGAAPSRVALFEVEVTVGPAGHADRVQAQCSCLGQWSWIRDEGVSVSALGDSRHSYSSMKPGILAFLMAHAETCPDETDTGPLPFGRPAGETAPVTSGHADEPYTHPVCAVCFSELHPDRSPTRLAPAEAEACCYCGIGTASGIYVRADPRDMPCCTAPAPREGS